MSSGISFPPKLTFKEFLSHTFPGFFLALSVFMLLDVLSPKDLTSWAFGTLTEFLSAMAFIILLGTILGILIDGIQHLIEEKIFVKCPAYEKVKTKAEGIYPDDVGHYYYYERIGGDAFEHLTDNYYRYAEFYGNIFISLIAFSCVAPFYLCDILKIPWDWSIIFGWVVPLIFAPICIYSSYTTFVKYHSHRIDMILESLGSINTIEVTVDPKCSNITAQLKRWKLKHLTEDEKGSLGVEKEKKKIEVWKASDAKQRGVKIYFTTDSDQLSPKQKETDKNGRATMPIMQLGSTDSTTVNAYSEGFIPGEAYVGVMYLFSWDNVQSGDKLQKFPTLLRFLRDYLKIGWAESAKISKTDDKTIHILNDKKFAEIKIGVSVEKATLKISDGRTYDLKVKKENGKRNIYKMMTMGV